MNCLRAVALTLLLAAVLPAAAHARSSPTTSSAGAGTGGAAFVPRAANMVARGSTARLLPDGTAAAPANAPVAVQRAIFAANRLQHKPYIYGGGHGSFRSGGYDCSGTVSYALHGARLLRSPLDSSSFMSWGLSGAGRWITVYTNPGHAFVVIAGLRLDTSRAGMYGVRLSRRIAASTLENGPRWRPLLRDTAGFTARHPRGL